MAPKIEDFIEKLLCSSLLFQGSRLLVIGVGLRESCYVYRDMIPIWQAYFWNEWLKSPQWNSFTSSEIVGFLDNACELYLSNIFFLLWNRTMVLSNGFSLALAVPFVRRRCEHLDRNLKAAARSREKGRHGKYFVRCTARCVNVFFPHFLMVGGVVAMYRDMRYLFQTYVVR